VDNLTVNRNFSRSALLYDQYADIQKKTALKLAEMVDSKNIFSILELGCGTGNYTRLLREKYKTAHIKALDISERMIDLARDKLKQENIEFIVGDAQELDLKEKFDLVTSNACLQWLGNLKNALSEYAALLQEEGVLLFSIFGPQTFGELNAALKKLLPAESVPAASFCDQAGLGAILKHDFRCVKIEEVNYRENLGSLKELLEKIKYLGIRGNGLSKENYFSRGLMRKIEKVYRDQFQDIRVTYQVFICQGRKR